MLGRDIVKDEVNEQLWDEVSSLSFKSREVIYLHYYLDLKFTEIAEILNIPIGTCKSRLNTALKSLRKKIPECEYTMKPSSRFGG
ncbi:hypothetical protein GC097_01370 [Paenibacillus sp. LMG 31457]|uniref:RNA polymerase sigma factor 70 region 4 type 2 domain-containing protein n=1 Tax=Paenibacillus planticolens TaxID=2654976 RepID=A0ABX1ZG80_9BACL|nr:hypothetical protein [Paenibacillus planticolens]